MSKCVDIKTVWHRASHSFGEARFVGVEREGKENGTRNNTWI